MQWNPVVRAAVLSAAASALLLAGATHASTITLDAIDSGWYDDGGAHTQSNENYLVGARGAEYRNFVVFDLTGAIPLGETLAAATLRLENPSGGYGSSDASESYEVVHVSTPVPTLIAGGTLQLLTFQDLGDGPVYATRDMSAADDATVVEIALNGDALDDIELAAGLFAIGGHVTTLASSLNLEFAFGSTGDTFVRQLVLHTVPEPASAALLGIGLAGLRLSRRPGTRRRRSLRAAG